MPIDGGHGARAPLPTLRNHRHFERSEAIQSPGRGFGLLRRFARRNDGLAWFRILAARFARAFKIRCPSPEEEGAGSAGCTLHPRSRVPKIAHLAHTSIQVSGN